MLGGCWGHAIGPAYNYNEYYHRAAGGYDRWRVAYGQISMSLDSGVGLAERTLFKYGNCLCRSPGDGCQLRAFPFDLETFRLLQLGQVFLRFLRSAAAL